MRAGLPLGPRATVVMGITATRYPAGALANVVSDRLEAFRL
jgi:hypothetical protein